MTHRPTELRYKRESRQLHVTFEDGQSFALPAELLRVESPSAEVQGHSASEKKIIAGRRHVGITEIAQVGHYAVRLTFDDLHSTGIYTWDYLYKLGAEKDRIWSEYLARLDQAGMTREP